METALWLVGSVAFISGLMNMYLLMRLRQEQRRRLPNDYLENFICECNDYACRQEVNISKAKYASIKYTNIFGTTIVSNSCKHGPEPTDELLETHVTYTVYKETSNELI